MRTQNICLLGLFALTISCNNKPDKALSPNIHFTSISSAHSNVHFNNSIRENDSVNLIVDAYTYMGGGVGIGDFDNDGLQDIFFGSSQQTSKLYRNKGNFVFEDITQRAQIFTSTWITGVSVVDINNDGYDDIYLCAAGNASRENRKNLLFINNKDLTFSEQAADYGLADTSHSTQAVFLDFDKDGDLDLYLLIHLLDHEQSNNIVPRDLSGNSPANDKLFMNEGVSQGNSHPHFTDISKKAGIKEDGYGLGIVVTDINGDGWPDLYVGNDYLENDFLWMNNRDGTFTNTITSSLKHQSYSTMGVEGSDINNDRLPDIVSLDMQPETNERKKMMYSFFNYDRFVLERQAGYEEEYMRNMLQLNCGIRNLSGKQIPFFSEIGRLSGISETDWSWSVLSADLNNDGWKDLHITNGLGRDMLNSDFISFAMATYAQGVKSTRELNRLVGSRLTELGSVALNNYCFKNNGDLTFANISQDAGLTTPSISNGAAYSDLDNDGDLDVIVNNINNEAFVLRNDLRKSEDSANNYITILLEGDSLNRSGIGTKITSFSGGMEQFQELNPARGYLSTVDKRLHFGFGNAREIDSLLVEWPDANSQVLYHVKTNQRLRLSKKMSVPTNTLTKSRIKSRPLFFETKIDGLTFKHRETFYYDYGPQQTLPQKYSQLGPFMATGDVNGDGLTDVYIGGAKAQSGSFFLQQPGGDFIAKLLTTDNKPQEDLGCLFFDADGDHDLDLVVNSGGNEYEIGSTNYSPRLYINDGKGNFSLNSRAFPPGIFTSALCVSGADYDGDGDIDLFIGGRLSPGQYPVLPASYLLQNNNGHFTDVTTEVCPDLQYPGMITAALWTDINGDAKPDLILAGEFMPIRFYINVGGKLKDKTNDTGLQSMDGQWRSLAASDLDNDGDMDLVAGNFGLNNPYYVSADYPLTLFASDLDGNGRIDPILAYYIKNEKGDRQLFPALSRNQFAAQVPAIKKKFLLNRDYSVSGIEILFDGFETTDMLKLICSETRTMWLENAGGNKFIKHLLPVEAQFSPVNAIICADVDNDGNIDITLAGNELQAEVSSGGYDASYGLCLKGDGRGNFQSLLPAVSGFIVDGSVKDLKIVTDTGRTKLLIASVNDEPVRIYEIP